MTTRITRQSVARNAAHFAFSGYITTDEAHDERFRRQARCSICSRFHAQRTRSRDATFRVAGICSRRGWIVTTEFVDQGVSGSKESRPQLNQLMADAHRRKFDVVLVWKIDRFGRSLKHLVNALADLDAYGVAFVSLRDNLDLSTPSGRLMFQIGRAHV